MSHGALKAVAARFTEEADEHLDALSQGLMAIETGIDTGGGLAQDLLRRVHSMKGAARLAGAEVVARLAHELESDLAAATAGGQTPPAAAIDQLFAAADAIRQEVLQFAAVADSEGGSAPRLAVAGDLVHELPEACRRVLAKAQEEQIRGAAGRGLKLWLLQRLGAAAADLATAVPQALAALADVGEVVSVAASRSGPELRLTVHIVYASRRSEDELRTLAQTHGLILTAVGQAASSEGAEAQAGGELARLRELFIAENIDKIDDLGAQVLALESRPGDRQLLNDLFRRAHNFKGAGATFGLPAVTVLGHHLEAVLDQLRSQRYVLTPALTDLLLQAVDGFRHLFDVARAGGVPDASGLPVLAQLQEVLRGGKPEAQPAAAPLQLAPPPAKPPVAENAESIRVARSKIDGLVNLVSELTLSSRTREASAKALEGKADKAKDAMKAFRLLCADLDHDPELAEARRAGKLRRVDDRCARVARALGELVTGLDDLAGFFGGTTSHAAATVAALRREVTRISMVPVSLLFDAAPRLVRDLCRATNKEAQLNIHGGHTEIDKRVLEQMSDPLMHLLRNAIDHGIETPEERLRAGKERAGSIELHAEHRGDQVLITMTDDGHGIDIAKLKAKAVQSGILSAEHAAQLSAVEAQHLIFHPGLSTKSEVSEISGRGVGMDVVKANIEGMRGSIDIHSHRGRGTTFVVRLPLSLAIIQAVLVECGGQTYCMQSDAILEIIRVPSAELQVSDGRVTAVHLERTLPIVKLTDLLQLPGAQAEPRHLIVVVTQGMTEPVGLVVDKAADEQSVVLKRPGRLVTRVRHMAGTTILPDGRVSVVLNTHSLASAALKGSPPWSRQAAARRLAKRILIVDDSLTTRELFRVLLEAADFEVAVARHGKEAMIRLLDERFDLVVSDIQMPEMDGYELVQAIKTHQRLAALPVILLTGLASDEEKLRGLKAGADAYVVKGAFNQAGLLHRIAELTRASA